MAPRGSQRFEILDFFFTLKVLDMEVYRKGARGIQGPRFRPKPSPLQGRVRALRDGISSHGGAGNRVSDDPQTTLKNQKVSKLDPDPVLTLSSTPRHAPGTPLLVLDGSLRGVKF